MSDENERKRTMNKEQQRIAIAEACGWTECRLIKSYDGEQVPYGVAPNESPILNETPDYLNDLNAMHEALDKVENDGLFLYELDQVIWEERKTRELVSQMDRLKAKPHQLAEAFLKTIGKWEGEQP